MRDDALTRASRREHVLYGELAALYRGLLEALTDERAPVDAAHLVSGVARAQEMTGALAALDAELAPVRREGRAPAEVLALWRASATLAADAAATNRELLSAAGARQVAIRARRSTLAAGRQALTSYRPTGDGTVAVGRRA